MLVVPALTFVFAISACTSMSSMTRPVSSVSFADYRSSSLKLLATERQQFSNNADELQWNAPQEWQPAPSQPGTKPRKGVLLVHGLGDSPWSFHDLAPQLASQGFLVRTILLPGHGTHPEDLLDVTAEQWQEVVYEQAQTLEQDVDGPVYLGGFSTGANLVLDYAYGHPEIAGLILVSPGFKSFPFGWLAPMLSHIRPWLVSPDGSVKNQTPVRYMNVPTNAYAQFYRTSALAQELLTQPYNKPVFMVVAQHDSVIDTDYLLDVFQHSFTHPQSRLIWYGTPPEGLHADHRVLVKVDRIPAQRISQFSHMGLLFSPSNPLYGGDGSLRICLNSLSSQDTQACEDGVQTWYSDWGYREDGKIHARLTFNPYFDWQTKIMAEVLDEQTSSSSSGSAFSSIQANDSKP
ncbi:alpha/beta fold hydrolase [Pseudomonas sp. ALS1131]|nr:alpha/beta fold hydrolase [Pseudomonas sp. ALS1131]